MCNVYCICLDLKKQVKLNLLKSKFICIYLPATNDLHRNNFSVHSLKCNHNFNTKCD